MRNCCAVEGCQGEVEIIYLDQGVCAGHWNELTADGVPTAALGMALGVELVAPDAMEDEMPRKKKTDTTATAEAAPAEQAETTPKPATTARTKRPRTAKRATEPAEAPGAAEASAPAPATDKPKSARTRKPKADKAPKDELVVFAIRLTQAERDAIHEASGPRNATQFVRRVAAAFANADESAFKAVVRDAREARG